ncbi:MAG: FeoA family protein [Chloroflexota bacterium]
MSISESATQEWTVATVPRGTPVDIVAIGTEAADLLMVHGIRPGARLVVDSDAPFGGPCIVRVGRSRVAIDRRLANTIRVEFAVDDPGAATR